MIKPQNPNDYAKQIQSKLHALKQDLRQDIPIITDPKAQALLETSAEVIGGLERAFEHYENKSEHAWK